MLLQDRVCEEEFTHQTLGPNTHPEVCPWDRAGIATHPEVCPWD